MSIIKVFIFLSLIFNQAAWGDETKTELLLGSKTIDKNQSVDNVTIPEAPYVFDYTKDNQNDCWDVNTNDEQWLSFTKINNNNYPENIKDKLHKKTLCHGLVYYRSLTSDEAKNSAVKSSICNVDASTVDPVCDYYKKLYDKKEDELANAMLRYGILSQSDLSGYKKTGDFPVSDKFKTIKACQWISTGAEDGYCAPRANVSIGSGYTLPGNLLSESLCRESENNSLKCLGWYVNEDAFIRNKDDAIKVLKLFRYLLEKQDKFLTSRFTFLSGVKSLIGMDQKKLYQKIVEPKLEDYAGKKSFSLNFKDEALPTAISKDAKGDAIEDYVLDMEAVSCDDFDKTDPFVINLLSNVSRSKGDKVKDACRIFVLKVKKIETVEDKTTKAITYSVKDSKSVFRNTEFIYDDDYMAFLPIVKFQGKYSINSDSQGDAPLTERYNTICEDLVGQTETIPKKGLPYLKDMQNIVVAQALIGGNAGAPAFKADQKKRPVLEDKNLQLLSKGDLVFNKDNNRYNIPRSMQKLSALAFYCDTKVNLFTPLRMDQKVVDFEKKFSKGFETAAEYEYNVKYKGLRVKKDSEEPYKDVLGFISEDETLLSNSDLNSSTLYTVFIDRDNLTSPTVPKAYSDELDYTATYQPHRAKASAAKFGTTKFYYALAEKAGYVINTDVADKENWEFVEDQLVVSNSIEKKFPGFNLNRFYDLLVPSLYSDGIGAPIATADNVYYFMQTNAGNMLGTAQTSTSSYQFWMRAFLDAFENINGVSYNNSNIAGTGKTGRGRGSFLSSITGETLTKAGMLGLTYLMTNQQLKMDRERIKSQMQMEAIKARMNQCSSLDCTVKEDMCKLQTVSKDKKFLGIKTGTKYVAIDPSECNFCGEEVLQEYRDPYTGETKMMSLYEICLANVVGGMLTKNPCYDLIATSNKYPGMISDADIRRCFLGLPAPTARELNVPYVGAPVKTATDKTAEEEKEEEKKDDKKATTAGAPAGGGGTSSPGGPNAKRNEPFDRTNYGGYGRGGKAPSGPSGSDYYYRRDAGAGTYGGAETAAQAPSGTGLVVGTPSEELGIERMTKDVNRATGQALTVPPAK